jgi:hypothetical protein
MSTKSVRCTQRILIVIVLALLARDAGGRQVARFELVAKDLFAAGGSFVNAWADYDSDGDVDLFVGFDGRPNRLYRNHRGTFSDEAAAARIADARPTRAAAWGDPDGDGDPDLLVGFTPGAGPVLRFYRNSRGVFSDETAAVGLIVETGAVRQPVWVDFDGDQDLDLFVAFRDRANAMFRNDRGRFVDVAASVGLADSRRSVGAVWFDHDEDGDLDLVVGNMDGDANGLFSSADGQWFADVADKVGVAWGGRTAGDKGNGTVRPCVADVNGDGHLDLFFANYGKNGLFLNRGKGVFEDVSAAWGVAIDARYDTCAFGDYDNDGNVDLYVNGTVTGGRSYDDFLYRNTGARFENVTPPELGSPNGDHGAQWIDYDMDGDVDLALTGVQKDAMHWLLRNSLPAPATARALQVRILEHDGAPLTPGSEVWLRARTSGRIYGKQVIDAGSGYNSQNLAPLHFAVPDEQTVNLVIRPMRRLRMTTMTTVNPLSYRGKVFEYRMPVPKKFP